MANYDKYLHDRFGLLAVAQSPEENALSASLLSYLNKNQLTDIAGLDVDSVSVAGLYPLANTAVLRRQIEEYGKFLVPAKVAADFGNIEDIVKELEKKATGLLNVVKLISSASSAVGAEADSIAKADELKEVSNAVQKADTAYDTKYSEWKKAVKDLIAHLATCLLYTSFRWPVSRPRSEGKEGTPMAKNQKQSGKKDRKGKEPPMPAELANPLKEMMPNYRVYQMSGLEKLGTAAVAFLAGGVCSQIFYGGLFRQDGEDTILTYISAAIVILVVGLLAVKLLDVYKRQRCISRSTSAFTPAGR